MDCDDDDDGIASGLQKATQLIADAQAMYNIEKVAAAVCRIEEARKLLCELKDSEVELSEKGYKTDGVDTCLRDLETNDNIKNILNDNEIINRIILDANSDEGWKVQRKGDKDDDDIRVLYKAEPSESLITLRIQGQIACPLLAPLAVINEVDLSCLLL